jgi:transposase
MGENHSTAKLTDADVRLIRALLADGMLQRIVASKFNVSLSTIKKISCGETWRHVK